MGAALGGPLVLPPLGYGAVGLPAVVHEPRNTGPSQARFSGKRPGDQAWFVGIFLLATLLGTAAFTGKTWLAPVRAGLPLVYARRELTQTDSHEAQLPEPLGWIRPPDPGARQGAGADSGSP